MENTCIVGIKKKWKRKEIFRETVNTEQNENKIVDQECTDTPYITEIQINENMQARMEDKWDTFSIN